MNLLYFAQVLLFLFFIFFISIIFVQAGLVLIKMEWASKEWEEEIQVLELLHFYLGQYQRYRNKDKRFSQAQLSTPFITLESFNP